MTKSAVFTNLVDRDPATLLLARMYFTKTAGAISDIAGKIEKDPVVAAISKPSKMNRAQKINTGIGGAAALAGTTGIYTILDHIPWVRRKPILKAILAATGGAAMGYAGWRTADRFQKA